MIIELGLPVETRLPIPLEYPSRRPGREYYPRVLHWRRDRKSIAIDTELFDQDALWLVRMLDRGMTRLSATTDIPPAADAATRIAYGDDPVWDSIHVSAFRNESGVSLHRFYNGIVQRWRDAGLSRVRAWFAPGECEERGLQP